MEIIEVVNRTTKPLNFVFDGVPGVVRPGYKLTLDGEVVPAGRDGEPFTEHLPKDRAEMARRQNVIMGTEDRWNFNVQEYLVGAAVRDEDGHVSAAPGWPFNAIDHTEQSDALERFNRETMGEGDRGAVTVPASGFPRGRQAAMGALHYNEGGVHTQRTD